MSRRKHLTPAEVVINEFGVRPLARELETDPTTIMRWRSTGGGLIPSRYHIPLLDLARKQGRTLTETDLVHGR